MRKSEKVVYEVDPFNRLVASKTRRKSKVAGFRHVLDGTFKIDKNNTLFYRVKSPSSSSIPQQLKLSGDWSLDKKHNLILTLDKENNQRAGDTLTLNTEIINAKADKLEFSLATKDSQGKTHFYMLRLSGKWQTDKYNRLSFLLEESGGIITLMGAWEVNQQNQITYTYIKEPLKRRKKITRTVTFKGFWDITEKYRLLYVLNKELNSGFEFKVSAGKPAKRGLQYEIGIDATAATKRIALFGSWKIDEKLGLVFEMPYEGKIRSLIFSATCKLKGDYTLELKLKNHLRQDLGIDVKLSRNILKGMGEAYLQALKEGREISLAAGIGFRW